MWALGLGRWEFTFTRFCFFAFTFSYLVFLAKKVKKKGIEASQRRKKPRKKWKKK